MALLVLLNNFLHDFSAAGWLFGTVFLWSLLRQDTLQTEDGKRAITTILHITLLLMKLSLAGIIGFGIIRALAYKQYEWNAAAGASQITLLVVKHILLTGVFAVGVWYYRKATVFLKTL